MRRDVKNAFESWLVGELWLVLLLGSAAALFLTSPVLRHTYFLPEGRLVLDTAVVLAATVVAILAAVRFSVERRPLDLLLAAGFFTAGMGTLAFSVVPVLGGAEQGAPEAWAAVVSRVLAATFIAAAPLVPERRVASGARAPSRARPCRSRRSLRSGPPCTHGETVSVRWTRPGTATRCPRAHHGDGPRRPPRPHHRDRLRDPLPAARRRPRQLARARRDPDALRRAELRAVDAPPTSSPGATSWSALLRRAHGGVWQAIRFAELGGRSRRSGLVWRGRSTTASRSTSSPSRRTRRCSRRARHPTWRSPS